MSTDIAEAYAQTVTRLQRACEAAGRAPSSVKLVAVSKTKPNQDILAAYQAGCRDFGENYAQEIIEKAPALPADIRWHFIGHLQSNKAKRVAPLLSLLHTLDSVKLAKLMQEVKPLEALLQVNIGLEPQKEGVLPNELLGLLRELAPLGVKVRGLMCIPPAAEDPEASRPHFAALRRLREQAQQSTGLALPELSMGMTLDAAVAIQEGATLVRVGTAIFGGR